MRRISLVVFGVAMAIAQCGNLRTGAAAVNERAVQEAIARGAGKLRGSITPQTSRGRRALYSLTLLKAHVNAPEIQQTVTAIRSRINGGTYEEDDSEHVYTAGVEAVLLADSVELEEGQVHPYAADIKAIADYILAQQLSNGGWDYPRRLRDTNGDTSLMQYALLGLWAAERAGVRVPGTAWQNAIEWHIRNQNSDGGYGYVPGTNHGFGQGSSMLNMTVNAIGSVYICIHHLTPGGLPDITDPRIVRPNAPQPMQKDDKFGGQLQQVELDNEPKKVEIRGEIPAATEQMLTRAYAWLVPRFAEQSRGTGFQSYYYYSLERMGALVGTETIGNAPWFETCANFVIKEQGSDGGWDMSQNIDPSDDTAMIVLFLTRSTGKIVPHRFENPIGAGLMRGKRGDVFGTDEGNKPNARLSGLDQLLAALENPGEFELQDVQQQIVKDVQLGDRSELINQKDLLLEYIEHPKPEVRRTAAWALGRTNDFSLARKLIEALDDVDVGVMIEARNALCWLARLPKGLGEAADPYENLPDNATEDQKKDAVAAWHAELIRKWGNWYLENRPYRDRGDEFEAQLLQKIAAAGA